MPLYDLLCPTCGKRIEKFMPINSEFKCTDCNVVMQRGAGSVAFLKVQGQGYPSRKKWMDNWTPDSPAFSTGSLHGEKY